MSSEQPATVQLPQGPLRYRDTGEGEPILFVHGALVDGQLWSKVTPRLEGEFRCIVPDLPLGAHVLPMKPDADLTPPGLARLIDGFAGAIGLGPVTLVGNDTGGALCQLVAANHGERVARLVLTNCDSHDRFPPFPFNVFKYLAFVPGGLWAMGQPFRSSALMRRVIGTIANEPIPDDILDTWARPSLENPDVRRDLGKLLKSVSSRYTLEAAERLRSFDRPALVAWAPNDPFFKLSYAERLAREIPDCRLELVEGSRTFMPWDRPERLAELIAGFVRAPATAETAS